MTTVVDATTTSQVIVKELGAQLIGLDVASTPLAIEIVANDQTTTIDVATFQQVLLSGAAEQAVEVATSGTPVVVDVVTAGPQGAALSGVPTFLQIGRAHV